MKTFLHLWWYLTEFFLEWKMIEPENCLEYWVKMICHIVDYINAIHNVATRTF